MHELNWSCCYNDPTHVMNFSGYATDYVDYLQIMLATKKLTTSYTVNSNHYTANIRSIWMFDTIYRLNKDGFYNV